MTTESLNKTWFVDIDGTIVKHIHNDAINAIIEKYSLNYSKRQ